MWREVNKFEQRGLGARSWRCSETKASAIDQEFELGIFFGTYERRGLVGSTLLARGACHASVVVLFAEKDTRGLRDKYDPQLLEQVSRCTQGGDSSLNKLAGAPIRSVDDTLLRIIQAIPPDALAGGARWFVDMTGSPKPYYLGLLAYLRQMVVPPRLYCFHPEGDYEKEENPENAFAFTTGPDRYTWVPYLWGHPQPSLPWTYVFLLGFEGNRSYDIFTRFEPRFVKALIAKPGYRPQYPQIAEEQNARFLEESGATVLYAPASDVVETWKVVAEAMASVEAPTNLCIVPLGPKPHALAGGLAALSEGSAAVLYLVPRSWRTHDVYPGDSYWLYEIQV